MKITSVELRSAAEWLDTYEADPGGDDQMAEDLRNVRLWILEQANKMERYEVCRQAAKASGMKVWDARKAYDKLQALKANPNMTVSEVFEVGKEEGNGAA